jgi:PAS domain S-box-containing protein
VQRDDDGPRPGQSDLLAGVPDAVYRLDRDGRMTYVNAPAEALLERRADELIGRHALKNFPASRGTVAEIHIREVLADRQPRQFAYYYEPQERWYEVRVFPHADGLAVFFRDIDDWYRNQQQREAELGELTAVLAALRSATVLLDEGGRILVTNRAWDRDGELLRSSGIQPGRVGDGYIDAISRGLRPADGAAIAAALSRLQAEPRTARRVPSTTSTRPSWAHPRRGSICRRPASPRRAASW